MASALSADRDYQWIAENYSKSNKPQLELGKKLIDIMGLKSGDKVLDMGCGTGEITSYIVDQVGEKGSVIGVDPDEQRINIAVQKHFVRPNINFVVGDSSSHFPHFNEGYYDAYVSNFVLQWLSPEEKAVFVETAWNCLKPGGRVALHCQEECPEIFLASLELFPDNQTGNSTCPFQLVGKSTTESMLEKSGFTIVSSEYVKDRRTFPSLACFLTWFCASHFLDERKVSPDKKNDFARKCVREDGTVYFEAMLYRIIATK